MIAREQQVTSELEGEESPFGICSFWEPPGFLGLNYGYRTPATQLIAQVAYVVVLGAFLPG